MHHFTLNTSPNEKNSVSMFSVIWFLMSRKKGCVAVETRTRRFEITRMDGSFAMRIYKSPKTYGTKPDWQLSHAVFYLVPLTSSGTKKKTSPTS